MSEPGLDLQPPAEGQSPPGTPALPWVLQSQGPGNPRTRPSLLPFRRKKLNNRSAALDAEYEELTEEYQKILQGDTSYLQRTARVKYHLAKPGEIEFRIEK